MTTALDLRDPADWTADGARRFVWDVWGLLQADGGDSLHLRELQPYGTYRLEFVADTGSAVVTLTGISGAALAWLQTTQFDLSPARAVQ